MAITELKIANQIMRLECDNPVELRNIAEALNSQIDKFKQQSGEIGDFKAVAIVALQLQDKLLKLQKDLDLKSTKEDVTNMHDQTPLSVITEAISHMEQLTSQLQSAIKISSI